MRTERGASSPQPPPLASQATPLRLASAARSLPKRISWRWMALKAPSASPYAGLLIVIVLYASLEKNVLSLETLNLECATALALAVAGVGQTIVILTGGIDLSIGGTMSLVTVLFATRHIGNSTPLLLLWLFACLVLGCVVGLLNGLLISRLRLQPFIVTLATWSILSGVALWVLPVDGGTIPTAYTEAINSTFLGLDISVWIVIALVAFGMWFRRSRLGIGITAIGSDADAAYASGAPLARTKVAAYLLAGLFAAAAGLLLTTQTATGSPTGGESYVLQSVAVVVIGGTYLAGGRGSIGGTIAAAFILTLIANVVFALALPPSWTPLLTGVLLVVSVGMISLSELYARWSST